MTYVILIFAALPLLLVWLAAEFRARPAIRIGLGLCALTAACGASYFFGAFSPSYALLDHQQAMARLRQHFERGEGARVQAAFQQAEARPASEGNFARRLWTALDSGTTPEAR